MMSNQIRKFLITKILLQIFAIDAAGTLGQRIYEVHFTFDTYKENREYVWSINIDTDEIKAINPEAKRILDLVYYYD